MKNKTKTIKKVHKKLPPHRHQAHPAVKEKDINKVFIVTVLSIFIVVVLSLLLLLSPKSVGKASFTGAEEMQAGIFVNPDDNFLVTNKSSSIPINVNIGTNKTTVFSFNITYNSLEFEVDCSNVFDILDEKFGYVDEANPGLVFIREAKCGFLGRVEFNFAALPSETAYITANEIIANLKVTPIGIGGGKEFNFNKFDVYSLDDGNKINLDISDATFTFILEGGEVIAPFADLVIVRGIGDDKKFWISESTGSNFKDPENPKVITDINYPTYQIYSGDFNDDGSYDILVSHKVSSEGKINITFRVMGDEQDPFKWNDVPWAVTSVDQFPVYETKYYVGDFNGDSIDDLLQVRINEFQNNNSNFYLMNSTGTSFSDPLYVGAIPDILNYNDLFVNDIDGDGDDEIAVNFYNYQTESYSWKRINFVNGVFFKDIQWNATLGVSGDKFLVGDFMTSAGEELVVLHQDTNNGISGVKMSLVRFNGNNTFSAPMKEEFIPDVDGENHKFYAEDFDGDGKDEIAVARINGNTVTWWVMGDTYDPFVWNDEPWITDAGNDGDTFIIGKTVSLASVSGDAIFFADPNLELAVRNTINKPTGQLYLSDVEGISYLSAPFMEIANLSGIEYLTGLGALNLPNNNISDISPLSGLTNLTNIYLSNNNISNLSPLSGLTNLTKIYLDNNQISDISPLSGLTNLKTLELYSNQISDISALSSLTHLSYLRLSSNNISDISPLTNLTNLNSLSLVSNKISNLSPLSGLTNLIVLTLYMNKISDLSPLSGLINLYKIDLYANPISDLSPLSNLTNLYELRINKNLLNNKSCCVISEINSTGNLQVLYDLNCTDFNYDVCNAVDSDGDGHYSYADCDDNNASVWKLFTDVYVDNDGDTYGTGGSLNICAGETLIGYSNKASDCDDNNSQLDVCGDGLDCEDYACVVKSNSDSDCSTCVSGCDTNNTYELNYCFDKYDLCNNITCVYDYPGDSNATLRTACQANCSINNNLCTTNATTNYNTCKTSCGCTENCNNTIDDDYDSLIDCEDDSCAGNSACVTLGTDDTGTDDTSSSSSSGGGGNYCSSNWKCGTWSFCNATLKQTRTCQDLKHCKDDKVEEQNCTKCIESWTCQAWTDCSSELQSRTCVDSHLCGTTFLKPKLQRECLMPGSKGYIPPNSGNYVAPDQPEPVLPAVLQQPKQSFWQEHKIAITASGLGILLLGALIFLLIHFISKHKPAGEEDLTALKNWVKKERELGASNKQIKETLMKQSDWTKSEIDKVI